jgi:hypothetical protein
VRPPAALAATGVMLGGGLWLAVQVPDGARRDPGTRTRRDRRGGAGVGSDTPTVAPDNPPATPVTDRIGWSISRR